MRRTLPALLLLLALAPAPARAADPPDANGLHLAKIGDFSAPVYVTSPPGDTHRVFVVEKGDSSGADIRVVRDGTVLPQPFLHVANVGTGNEQGLLSMAFAPDYATSGRFYIYYVDGSASACAGGNCDIRVDEYLRATDDTAEVTPNRTLFTVSHRENPNHNGAQVAFGPDGLLYAGPGDGGGGDDSPHCNAPNPASVLGKILRMDPSQPGTLTPQVYALGLRNPFRFSFDRLTGDLLVGDVGQNSQEEVDFLAGGSAPGANFGWSWREGTAAHANSCSGSQPPGLIDPSITYPTPDPSGAVTGGVVVRDSSVSPLLGRYIYADFYAGEIRSAVVGPSSQSGDGPTGLQVDNLSSFGQDARCQVYVTSLSGPVYRLEAVAPAGVPACQTVPGAAAPPLPIDMSALDRTAPRLSRVTTTRRRFRVSANATPRVARVLAPAGTKFGYTVSELSEVSLRFYRATSGRRSRGRCVAVTRRLRGAPRCTRYPLKGTLVRRRVMPGRHTVKFTGRVGVKALPPGRYRAIMRARDAAGNVSAGRVLKLTIVAR